MNFRSGYFAAPGEFFRTARAWTSGSRGVIINAWRQCLGYEKRVFALTVDILKRSQPDDAIALGVDFHKGGEIHRGISKK